MRPGFVGSKGGHDRCFLMVDFAEKLPIVQVAIASFQGQYSAAWNYIMAASVVVALPTLFLFFVFQRQLVESIKTTGIK